MSPHRVRAVLLTAIVCLAGVMIVLLTHARRSGPPALGARPEADGALSIDVRGGMNPSTLQPRLALDDASNADAQAIVAPEVADPGEEDAAPTGDEEEVGFLPFPNRGELDFAEKYDSMSVKELYYRVARMNDAISAVAQAETVNRIEAGLYVVHEQLPRTGVETEEDLYFDKPVGLGQVWPCSMGAGLDGSNPEVRITYLTEAEYPELFAMRDEWFYAAKLCKKKWNQGK